MMRRLAIGLVALFVGATAAAADSWLPFPWFSPHDRDAPPPAWCNQGNFLTGGIMDCSYFTERQCIVSARGVGGTCIPNPAYQWPRYYNDRPSRQRY